MKKGVIIFFLVLFAGIALTALFTYESDELSDTPITRPTRHDIIPAGTAATDVVQTVDETRIPELLIPTPTVKTATRKLLNLTCSHGTDRCKLQAIYDFVRMNYEYNEGSPLHNYIQSPTETLYYGSGDAFELALVMASMQRAAGFESEIVEGPYHLFVRTWLGNQTIMMDPSCTSCRVMDAIVTLRGDEKIYR